MHDIENINKARVIYYGLFSSLFSHINDEKNLQTLFDTITYLKDKPFEENSSIALKNMWDFLKEDRVKLIEENNEIFFSPSTTFIPTTASFYDEGRDEGKKRVEMIALLLKSNFRKNDICYKDSEDEISFILKFVESLIKNNISLEENISVKEVFENILNDFVDTFLTKLYEHESSKFYKDVALVFKVFVEFERSFLSISKTKHKQSEDRKSLFNKKKKEFRKRAKRNFDEVTSL